MKGWFGIALVIFAFLRVAPAASPETTVSPGVVVDRKTSDSRPGSPQTDFARLLATARVAYTNVNDYVSTIVVEERIEGVLRPREVGFLKFKKPFSVYIKWIEGPQANAQALYVEGLNNGKMLARRPGLLSFLTFRLEPASKLALRDNRHPITEAGIGYLLDILGANFTRATTAGQGRIQRLADNPRLVPQGTRYELRVEANDKDRAGYYCHRAVVTFDPKIHLVVAVQVFDWENLMVEYCRYLGLRLNVGLSERDFDPENPEYGF